ncbi:unnamed protein product [Gongylonema pulchrum]|uniref:Thioredoxin domain-containing protein n=1 Tax=Gongylonema pulchrum TaxID=637853 RepID=A0A183EWR5_9BILA|nr:unnamed protein product [Gongylonema pulchrum]
MLAAASDCWLLPLLVLLAGHGCDGQEAQQPRPVTTSVAVDGTSVNEWRGYYKKEHSLVKPYQGHLVIFSFNY